MWVSTNESGDEKDGILNTQDLPDPEMIDVTDSDHVDEEQLTLADDDERLPWLEADDDYEEESADTGKLVLFALVGLLAILGLVGALYYFTQGGDDEGEVPLVAEGGTIEAPKEPFKVRPDDPGGVQVAGTGDVSYQVGEGEAREGVVGSNAPRPAIDRAQASASANGEATQGSAPATTTSTGVGVQVGAYSTRAGAEAGWQTLSGRLSALSGVSHRVVTGTVDGGTIYRLQAVAGSLSAAEAMCRSIRSEGGDCQVKR